MKAQRELKKNPKRAVEMIEKILEDEPYNRQANLVLKQAALAAGWPEIAVFALQTLLERRRRHQNSPRIGPGLSRAGRKRQRGRDLQQNYGDRSGRCRSGRLGKDASARASMKTGGWTQAESYRDLIKDKEAAVSLEQQSRPTPAGESPKQQIDVRERCERNPADLQLRFELGEHLFHAGRFREALPELQRARQNANARLKSMNLLGRCYRELGMLDLAAQQLEEAAQEISSMDAMKKEIVYNLGLVYELMGEGDKSIAAMKQIYQTDYGYRDVAARVERSYERKPS